MKPQVCFFFKKLSLVVYENISDKFDKSDQDQGHSRYSKFSPFTTIQTVRSYNSIFVQARKLILSMLVHLIPIFKIYEYRHS